MSDEGLYEYNDLIRMFDIIYRRTKNIYCVYRKYYLQSVELKDIYLIFRATILKQITPPPLIFSINITISLF